MNEIVQGLIDWIRSVDPVLVTVLAGIAIMLETSVLIGLVFPGDTVVIVASMSVENVWHGIALAVTVVVGALIGESIGFALGRWLGPRIRTTWIGRKVGEKNWDKAQGYVLRRGGPAIFLSRFIPVLHSLVPLTVGMSNFSYRRFLKWTAPACILWAAIYVTIGSLAAGSFEVLSDKIHGAGYIFVAIIAVFLIGVIIAKRVIQYNERRHLVGDDAEDPAPRVADPDLAPLANAAQINEDVKD